VIFASSGGSFHPFLTKSEPIPAGMECVKRQAFAIAVIASVLCLAFGARSAMAARFNPLLSKNWSGYIASGTTFSSVSSTWVQPSASCTSATTASAFWVGLGGASPSSPGLEQIGTSADCVRGRTSTYAWWEILPAAATWIPVAVSPGDTVTASVSVADTTTSFSLTNVTTGATFVTQETVSQPALDSAEWIAEAPSSCYGSLQNCTVLPLASFGSVAFGAAAATSVAGHAGTISDAGWTFDSVRLAGNNGGSATPSELSADGTSFNVAFQPVAPGAAAAKHSAAPAKTHRPKRGRRGH
jgi:Peptidase A4 family